MHGLAKNVLHLVAVFVVALIFQQSLWCYHTPVGGCVRRDSFVGLLTPVSPRPPTLKTSATLNIHTRRDDDKPLLSRSYPRCTGRDIHPRKRGSMNYTNRSSSVMNVNSLKQRCRLKLLATATCSQERTVGGANTITLWPPSLPEIHTCAYISQHDTNPKPHTVVKHSPTSQGGGTTTHSDQQNQTPTQRIIDI